MTKTPEEIDRSDAILLGQDIARVLKAIEAAQSAVIDATLTKPLGSRSGELRTIAQQRDIVQRLRDVDGMALAPARELLRLDLAELDNVYGISEEVRW